MDSLQCARCGGTSGTIDRETGISTCLRCGSKVDVTAMLRAVGDLCGTGREPLPPEVETAAAVAGNRFGRYIRVRPLGRGGMGEVWKGWDCDLSRWVAMKFPLAGDPDEMELLKREAQVAGRLAHPNVASIYEIGEAHGKSFIAMQYVDGATLDDLPRKNPRTVVRWIRDAARAVGAAHAQGIVHRDLKPANVMIEKGTEHVYVMDFGLARPAGRDDGAYVVGTPAYMAPEQFVGGPVGVRSDLYSLGATLYELLSSKPPFDGGTVTEVMRKATSQSPPPLRNADRDLAAIVMKCLDKLPSNRYASAEELANDLGRWEMGEAVRARPASAWYRCRKRLARRKSVLAVGALAVAALGAALAILVPTARREQERKREAERTLALWQGVSAVLSEAEINSRGGEVERARRKLGEAEQTCRSFLSQGESAHARFFLGRLLHAHGRSEEAESELSRALEIDPNFGEARLARGIVRVERYLLLWAEHPSEAGDFEDLHPQGKQLRDGALADLAAPSGRTPYFREVDARYGKAELARMRGESAAAREGFEGVLSADPLYERAYLGLAKMEFDRGAWEEGVRRATQAIECHRGYLPAYRARVHAGIFLCLRAKRGTEGRKWATVARDDLLFHARFERDSAWTLTNLGVSLACLGDSSGAIEKFGRALEIDPSYDRAFAGRARVWLDQGEWDAAVRDASRAIEINPDLLSAWLTRSTVRRSRGDWDAAIHDCDHALRVDPRCAPALANRGVARVFRGEPLGAKEDCDQAVRLDPENWFVVALRGVVREETRNLSGALEDYTRAIDLGYPRPDLQPRILDLKRKLGRE